MKATWLNTEYEALLEIISSKIVSNNGDLLELKHRYNKENAEIDDLPWYKSLLKVKHDINASLSSTTELVYNIRYVQFNIAALKRLQSKICKAHSSSSIILDEDELQLLFG